MHDISIYIGNLCVQSKIMIRTKWTYSLPPSRVFLIAENSQFSDFHFNLWKIKSNYMSGLFCIANLLEVGRKKTFS